MRYFRDLVGGHHLVTNVLRCLRTLTMLAFSAQASHTCRVSGITLLYNSHAEQEINNRKRRGNLGLAWPFLCLPLSGLCSLSLNNIFIVDAKPP